jgi:hypothetical protein
MPVNTSYDTIDLLGVIPSAKTPARFLRDRLFATNIVRFRERKIALDAIREDQRVAPYVSPVIAGRPRRERGFETRYYEAPYVKEKSEIKMEDAFDRGPGESLGGDQDPQARYDQAVGTLTAKHEERITRREELQAVELLRTGRITVSGDGYDTMQIDFLRASSQTKVLTSTARWSQAADALVDMQTWSFETQRIEYGGPLTFWAMDPVAAQKFVANVIARGKDKMLDTTLRGSNGEINFGPQAEQVYRIGSANGMEFWCYQGQVELTEGSVTNILPDNTVIGVSPAFRGALAYGAIRVSGVLEPMSRYPRIVGGPNQDPSTEHLVTESSPLCMAARVNASICVTVD